MPAGRLDSSSMLYHHRYYVWEFLERYDLLASTADAAYLNWPVFQRFLEEMAGEF